MRSALALCLLLAACQQLDTSASRGLNGMGGSPSTPSAVDPGDHPTADAGAPPAENEHPPVDDCEPVRAQARAIREANCALCHQSPAKEGNFYFVLDDSLLAKAVSSTGQRFVVPGVPDDSRLFRRIAAGEMPPRFRTQRPTPEDVSLLRDWITNCMGASRGAPPDAAPTVAPDAGAPPDPGDGCGKPGQLCCGANTCEGGGCCVLGQCRAQGKACGGEETTGGMDDGLPGMCMAGTCRKDGASCGGVDQPCCGESGSCTASHTGCSMGKVCQACGEGGQPCCQNGGAATCVTGQSCSFTGFGRPSMCEPCGAEGQPCCGNGLAAQKTCNMGLTCRFVAGMGDHCGK